MLNISYSDTITYLSYFDYVDLVNIGDNIILDNTLMRGILQKQLPEIKLSKTLEVSNPLAELDDQNN
jgi:hypothetical protein